MVFNNIISIPCWYYNIWTLSKAQLSWSGWKLLYDLSLPASIWQWSYQDLLIHLWACLSLLPCNNTVIKSSVAKVDICHISPFTTESFHQARFCVKGQRLNKCSIVYQDIKHWISIVYPSIVVLQINASSHNQIHAWPLTNQCGEAPCSPTAPATEHR